MRDFVRPVAAALGIAGLAARDVALPSTGGAFAQAKQQQMAPQPKQAPARPGRAAAGARQPDSSRSR